MNDITSNLAPQIFYVYSTLLINYTLITLDPCQDVITNYILIKFSRLGAKIWNCIPPSIRKLPKHSFKKKTT